VTTASAPAGKVVQTLAEKFPQAQFKIPASNRVGRHGWPGIRQSAIIRSLLSLFGILIYVAFRYEFYFASARLSRSFTTCS